MTNILSVVEEVVSKIIADIPENATTKYSSRCTPVIEEHSVCQLPERRRKDYKEGRRHDKPIPVHRQVVVNTVQEEVRSECNTVVGKIVVQVKQTAMQTILDQSPDAESSDPVCCQHGDIRQALASKICTVGDRW